MRHAARRPEPSCRGSRAVPRRSSGGGDAGSGPNGQSPRSARASTRVWSVPGGIGTKSSARGLERDAVAVARDARGPAPDGGLGAGGTRRRGSRARCVSAVVSRRSTSAAPLTSPGDEVAGDALERDAGAGRVDRRPLGAAVARDPVRPRRALTSDVVAARHVAHEHVPDAAVDVDARDEVRRDARERDPVAVGADRGRDAPVVRRRGRRTARGSPSATWPVGDVADPDVGVRVGVRHARRSRRRRSRTRCGCRRRRSPARRAVVA